MANIKIENKKQLIDLFNKFIEYVNHHNSIIKNPAKKNLLDQEKKTSPNLEDGREVPQHVYNINKLYNDIIFIPSIYDLNEYLGININVLSKWIAKSKLINDNKAKVYKELVITYQNLCIDLKEFIISNLYNDTTRKNMDIITKLLDKHYNNLFASHVEDIDTKPIIINIGTTPNKAHNNTYEKIKIKREEIDKSN